MSSWFAYPWMLTGLLLLPLLAICWQRTRTWRRSRLIQMGTPHLVARLFSPASDFPGLLVAALACAIVALAGPRWGTQTAPAAAGIDGMIVLDLSRSMLAEQPSRQTKARRVLQRFVREWEAVGQHRFGLVIFAGQAQVQFPLTADAEHLRFALPKLDAAAPAREIRPRPDVDPSGTRIGSALTLALESLPGKRVGGQHIVLLSDGDDPADDEEWLAGATRARERGVPVHVVAVGMPDQPADIPEPLLYLGAPVASRVHSERLEEIARRTSGKFFATSTGSISIFADLQKLWREAPANEEPAVAVTPHPFWLLAAAVVGLIATLRLPWRPAFAGGALTILVAAAPQEGALQQGNEAFARGDIPQALSWFVKAEVGARDPGLVAFNQGAAYFRLGNYSQAELCYRRALEDGQIPPTRQARAHFDRGTALLHLAQGKDRERLELAVQAFTEALRVAEDADLQKDARHNLEIALMQARQLPGDPPNGNAPEPKTQPEEAKAQTPKKPDRPAPSDPNGVGETSGAVDAQKSKKSRPGQVTMLRDEDQLQPLTYEETHLHLQRLRERLLRAVPDPLPPVRETKDW